MIGASRELDSDGDGGVVVREGRQRAGQERGGGEVDDAGECKQDQDEADQDDELDDDGYRPRPLFGPAIVAADDQCWPATRPFAVERQRS